MAPNRSVDALRRYHELLNETGAIAVEFLDFRDGRITSFEGLRERAEVLEAAGLDHAT